MSHPLLNAQDLEQINQKGISLEDIDLQLQNFRKGFPPIELVAPATVTDGIMRLDKAGSEAYANRYRNRPGDLKTVKFVPASGAASRMFKSLFEYLNEKPSASETGTEILEIIERIGEFAFGDELELALQSYGLNVEQAVREGNTEAIIASIVQDEGMNYGQMPKGLIKFHKYDEGSRTPVEEHMVEGAEYCQDGNRNVNLHFTVSSEHLDSFISILSLKQPEYEARYGVKYKVDFSIQRAFTDTIAVDPENRPFRMEDGSMLFRPGGHGALLANLDELDADLVFIKNIDNVCPDRMKPETYLYKRALAGILLENQQKAFRYIRTLESGETDRLDEIEAFIENNFCTRLPEEDRKLPVGRKASLLLRKLNRPVRICGMVKNEGEPGGGPFWARNRDGSVSLQIVEPAQINFADDAQKKIAEEATHFNPVDLVCATRDSKGNPFDLRQFTDPDTGLISRKSSGGKELKAQELPGLWNGSMSDWNTIFVEVPIETFNPVKTINDLLRPEHTA